ncbi:MAG TPA: Fic family protein, partial [Cyanobacteria bacterium UBA8553]|nr:Fic family protein [Cyanobacteria bacterium UBA8553]
AKAKSLYQELDPDAPPWESLPRPQQQILTRLLARVLDGVENPFVINPSDIASWEGVSDNTAREWLKEWATEGFVNPVLAGEGVRVRSYTLAEEWVETCFQIRQPSRGK